MEAALEQPGRPKSVVIFEVVSILCVVANTVLPGEKNNFGDFVELLTWIGLTLWVTRRRSRLARAIYTGLLLFGSAGILGFFIWEDIPADVLFWGALTLVALLIPLWWPSTTAWLNAAHQRD